MATGIFAQFSTADLLTLLGDVTDTIKNGKGRVVSSAGMGDSNTVKEWVIAPDRMLEEINLELERRNYGTRRYKRTSLRFV